MPPQVDATVNPEESSETIKNDVNLIKDKKNIVELTAEDSNYRKLGTDPNYKHEIRTYHKCVYFVLMHILAVCGLYLAIFQAKWQTNIWAAAIGFCALQASVLGAHRGFSHKSFKTKTPLKIVLLFFQVISGQKDAYSWARDHRVHHKFSDTDADPHNSERGIWFSHITWVLYKKHPLVVEKGKQIDMSDLESDKYIMFQRKYYVELYLIFAYLMPWLVPVFLWDEGLFTSLCVSHYLMYAVSLHCMLSINSIAHMYGTKPFDKRINPVQTRIVNWLTGGEGWHNFHHCFPWDYGLSEYGFGKGLSTYLIEFFAYCGLAYDLRKASQRVVEGHSRRHGDESHEILSNKTE